MKIEDFSPTAATPAQFKLIDGVTAKYADIASRIISVIPESAHRTAALRLLLESKMTLIHGITHS